MVRQSLTSRIFFHQLTDHHTKEERNSNEIRNRLREYNKRRNLKKRRTDYYRDINPESTVKYDQELTDRNP